MYKSKYANLMQHLMNEHNLILLDSEQQEIEKWLDKDLKAINYTRCCEELLCVDRWCYNNLTKDKKYTLIKQDDEYYTIVDDSNEISKYDKSLFELIKQ